jgi:hypothetical protein
MAHTSRNHSRRSFLKAGASLAALGVAAPLVRPLGAMSPPRNLIVVLAEGGWDPTYALDPKPGSPLVDTPEGDVRTIGGLPILTHASRPSVTEFFTRYASYGSVINGIQTRSFIHADCMKRVLTGTASDQNPDVAAIAAFEHAADLPVPYLALGANAKSGPYASVTGRAGTTNQLASLLAPPELAEYDPFSPHKGFRPSDAERDLVDGYRRASAERLRRARGREAANERQIEAFVQSIEREGRLRHFAASQQGFGEREYIPDLGVQTAVAVGALSGGLSHSVMVEFGGFDTHQDNTMQSTLHEAFFAGLIKLVETLESTALLDRTVVVVLSEMGRTPKLNDTGGKDHWPITSALVLGSGVRGGRLLGASDEALGAATVDLDTGEPRSDGVQLQTASLAGGILELLGVDSEAYFPGVRRYRGFIA